MADENKNQDPEEENKGASNDDDFGLPDFEFEALDDDDDDELTEESSETSEESAKEEIPEVDASSSDEEVPSIDDGDLEDLDLDLDDVDLENVDLEGIEDIDLDDLDDLGDLDLDDLDLEDLDGDLDDLDKTTEETEVPVAASAEREEDIFDDPRPEPKSEIEDFEDDGEFYEEESFEDFDAEFNEESPKETPVEATGSPDDDFTADLEDIPEPGDLPSPDDSDFDSSIFDDDTEGLDLGSGAEEPIPFAKRDLPPEYQGSDESEEEISQEEISNSRGKFVRIVVLGTVMFVAIGTGFLYWNGTLGELFGGEPGKEVVEKKETPKEKKETPPEKKSVDQPKAANEEAKPADTKAEKTSETKPKETAAKTTTPKPKEQPKQQPKKTTTRPTSTGGGSVATLGGATGQRHIIVASFLDEASAQAFAGKLAKQGESPSVIPPFNGAPNYRVSVASFAKISDAKNNLDSFRERFDGAWILRY